MVNYELVRVVALGRPEANKILDELLMKRMAPSGTIVKETMKDIVGLRIVEKDVFVIRAIIETKKRQKVLDMVRKIHSLKAPDVIFLGVKAANPDFIYAIAEEQLEVPQELRMLR